MGWRVEEGGKSEGRPVMERIGVESTGNITPRESGQTSIWSLITREFEKPTKEAKQMTADNNVLVQPPTMTVDWHAIDWQKANRERASAASAYREGNTGRQMGQGESLATPADPLVQRQSSWPSNE